MAIDFIRELKWRGMIHDMTPGTVEKLGSGMVTGYAGFDPSAPSLQIGNLVPIMMLLHLQRAGHKPLVLVGGATGMIGDPSGKSQERELLDDEAVRHNMERFKIQLSQFLDFDCGENSAELVNNHDWFKDMTVLTFLRDVGKHLTVGYMLAKETVRQRLESGISFTEFSYQLLQGYDFYWLYTTRDCVLQMGGSDQWGNITAGAEFVRRKAGGEAFAVTCPLVTRSDGTKFGKSACGERIWLDPAMTTPYGFYQFWLNCTDKDAGKFIRTFTTLTQEEIAALEKEHAAAPDTRVLQKALARDITVRVHSESACRAAVESSEILFGKGTTESLERLSEEDLLCVFDGVPQFAIDRNALENGIGIIELVSGGSGIFGSRGEARRMISGGGLSVNKRKISDGEYRVDKGMLLQNRYLLIQKGKKNYYLGIAR